MTKEINQDIIDHLIKLGNKEVIPVYVDLGICSELSVEFDFDVDCEDFIGWSKFSGNIGYPIPHPDFEPEEAFTYYEYELENHWLDDQYGDNRRELCLYLADLYQGRLNSYCK